MVFTATRSIRLGESRGEARRHVDAVEHGDETGLPVVRSACLALTVDGKSQQSLADLRAHRVEREPGNMPKRQRGEFGDRCSAAIER
jgi:hypothetical protein